MNISLNFVNAAGTELNALRKNDHFGGRTLIRELVRVSHELQQQDRWREAGMHLLEAFTHSVAVLGKSHPVTLSLRLRVSQALEVLGHADEAARHRSLAVVGSSR
jgi:hypothetical protein